jgi:hypothetical protein
MKGLKIFLKLAKRHVNMARKFGLKNTYYNQKLLCKYKDKHKDQRCFIIGNGPSLLSEDLDLLVNEITFGANGIHLIFDKTPWRPTYYSIVDNLVWKKLRLGIHQDLKFVIIPHYLEPRDSNISINIFIERSGLIRKSIKNILYHEPSIYGGYTVSITNLQLAIHMGCNPIFLLGMDHNYPGEINTKSDVPIRQSNEQTHFSIKYRKPGEMVNPAPIELMNLSYEKIRVLAESKGIKIINVTRGGSLDIFERKKLYDIL